MQLTRYRRWLWNVFPSRLLDQPFSFLLKNGERLTPIQLGVLGEKMAARYLRGYGCKILYKNYRGPKGGEVDVVVRDGDVLAFIEVKTRKRRAGSRPLDAVNAEKQALIARGARSWLALLPCTDFHWRFDVVEVVLDDGDLPEITWIKEAFIG